MRVVSRDILVSSLIPCSAGFYRGSWESVKSRCRCGQSVHSRAWLADGCRLMRLLVRWSIAGMIWRNGEFIFPLFMREIREIEKKVKFFVAMPCRWAIVASLPMAAQTTNQQTKP